MRISLSGSTKTMHFPIQNTMETTGIRQGMGIMHSDVMDTFFHSGYKTGNFSLTLSIYEPRNEKTNILHMRKQRRRSASR